MSEFQGVKEPDGSLEEVGVGQKLSLGCWGMETPDSVVLEEHPPPCLYVFPISHLLETLPRTLAGGRITG